MPAFTHLCKKVHISVAHDTVTLYDRSTSENPLLDEGEFDYNPNDPQDPFVSRISSVRPVHRNDVDHHYFHDDKFDKENVHYHMQFKQNIDELSFAEFLSILLEKKMIDAKEKDSCLQAFRQASNDAPEKFREELIRIQIKSLELAKNAKTDPKNYKDAAEAADTLYQTLKDEAKYLQENKAEGYGQFHRNCREAIKTARDKLQHHRGWSKIFLNLGAAIVGLGVFYLVAIGVNYHRTQGKHLFFHCITDSEKKLNQLQEAQEAILRV